MGIGRPDSVIRVCTWPTTTAIRENERECGESDKDLQIPVIGEEQVSCAPYCHVCEDYRTRSGFDEVYSTAKMEYSSNENFVKMESKFKL